MPKAREPQEKREGGAMQVESDMHTRLPGGGLRLVGIGRYRDHATLTNVPFSHAAVMKAIFLDLG